MPPALIIAGITAAISAAGTGYEMATSGNAEDAQKKALAAQQQASAQAEATQRKEAFTAANPNAQAATGGSLTGQAGQSFADVLAGLPNYYSPNSGAGGASAGGASAGGTPTGATNAQSPMSYQSLLSTLNPSASADFSGGFSNQPNQPAGGRFNLASLNLG